MGWPKLLVAVSMKLQIIRVGGLDEKTRLSLVLLSSGTAKYRKCTKLWRLVGVDDLFFAVR